MPSRLSGTSDLNFEIITLKDSGSKNNMFSIKKGLNIAYIYSYVDDITY